VNKELELWQFIAERLRQNRPVMLLVVAESSGSSPGRQGYKMAVGSDGELAGSIGGGVMEVNLVEQSRETLSQSNSLGLSKSAIRNPQSAIKEQVHQKNSPNASGMICSGKQTVIFKLVDPEDFETVESIILALRKRSPNSLTIAPNKFALEPTEGETTDNPKSEIQNPKSEDFTFEKLSDTDFIFTERLGFKNDLYIVGGGHCALALSELMSKMDFHISLFDDRPELNTIEKNRFAHTIEIIESYDDVADFVSAGIRSYVVVMTLGYKSDARVIRALIDKELRYFGVLGSNAKMASMFREFIKEGMPAEKLDRIRTPVGMPINSRTPEEIAVSIAAEIISVKNAG